MIPTNRPQPVAAQFLQENYNTEIAVCKGGNGSKRTNLAQLRHKVHKISKIHRKINKITACLPQGFGYIG